MPNIACRVIEISFLTLGDRFFGESIFPFLSLYVGPILKPLFEAILLILLDEL